MNLLRAPVVALLGAVVVSNLSCMASPEELARLERDLAAARSGLDAVRLEMQTADSNQRAQLEEQEKELAQQVLKLEKQKKDFEEQAARYHAAVEAGKNLASNSPANPLSITGWLAALAGAGVTGVGAYKTAKHKFGAMDPKEVK